MSERYLRFARSGAALWAKEEGGRALLLDKAPWNEPQLTGESLPLEGLELLVPAEPSKILCVGLNYRDHAGEMGMALPDAPLIFMKPSTAALAPGGSIRIPALSQRVDYEAELALVIGKRCGPGLPTEGVIFGYTCANDVTARDLQKKDGQWTRAKGFDSFCPLGPALVTGLDVSALDIACYVNGQPKQASNTRQLIFDPQAIVAAIAACMTLLPGDVILSGTPGGIGPLSKGDKVEVRIEKLGSLFNDVQ